jgi:hypothetical protein
MGSLIQIGATDQCKIFASLALKNQIIVGYKGKHRKPRPEDDPKKSIGDIDAGYIYTPYVPILSMGTITDVDTEQTTLCLATRGGQWAMPPLEGSLCDARSYYVSLQTQESSK